MLLLPWQRLEWSSWGKDVSFYILPILIITCRKLFLSSPFSGRSHLTYPSLPAQPIYNYMRRFAQFLRTMSRIFASGSVMSHSIFRPVTRASEHMVLARCHNNGSTKECHSPPRMLPIPWARWRKYGLLYIGPIPLSARQRPAWCRQCRTSESVIRNESRRRRWRVYIKLLKYKTTFAGVLLFRKAIGFTAVSIISIVMSRNVRFSNDTQYKFSKSSLQKPVGWITSLQKAVGWIYVFKQRTFEWLTNWGVMNLQ